MPRAHYAFSIAIASRYDTDRVAGAEKRGCKQSGVGNNRRAGAGRIPSIADGRVSSPVTGNRRRLAGIVKSKSRTHRGFSYGVYEETVNLSQCGGLGSSSVY